MIAARDCRSASRLPRAPRPPSTHSAGLLTRALRNPQAVAIDTLGRRPRPRTYNFLPRASRALEHFGGLETPGRSSVLGYLLAS